MDLLDIRLLRALGPRPFQGPARVPSDLRPRILARQVGLSRETVRKRLDRMREKGVVRSFAMVPNLPLLGLATTTFHMPRKKGRSKEDLVASWRGPGRVTGVFEFIGGDVCIEITHPRDEPVPGNVEAVMQVDGHPEPLGDPSPTSWRLLQALRQDAMRPLVDVAEEVACSARTARRLLRQLADRNQADVVAVVDPSAMDGLVASLFSVEAGSPSEKDVLQTLGDHRMSSWRAPDGTLWVTAFGATALELSDLRRAVEARPGVHHVTQFIPGRVEVDTSWVDERLAARVA